MSAATIITNATAGAPVLNGTEGSLSALFRYLAPILGWSIEFDNGPIIVVKPQSYKGGQALFYRIDDRAARGGYAPRVAEVRAYETMSDINTGIGLVGPVYVHKSRSANTTAMLWSIFGDAYGFHLFSDLCGQYPSSLVTRTYVGFVHKLTDAAGVCGLFGYTDGYGPFGQADFLRSPNIVASIGCYMHKDEAGNINRNVAVYVNSCKHPSETIAGGYSTGMSIWGDGDPLHMGQPVIGDGSAHSGYCIFPGLFYPLHKAGQGALVSPPVKVIGDYSYITVFGNNVGTANTGGVLINTTGAFRP